MHKAENYPRNVVLRFRPTLARLAPLSAAAETPGPPRLCAGGGIRGPDALTRN